MNNIKIRMLYFQRQSEMLNKWIPSWKVPMVCYIALNNTTKRNNLRIEFILPCTKLRMTPNNHLNSSHSSANTRWC